MNVERGDFEGEWVVHLFKRRVRAYLGHSIYEGRRVKAWRSGSTRGVYVVPWGDRVAGVQWRPSDNDTRAVTRATPDSAVFGSDAS